MNKQDTAGQSQPAKTDVDVWQRVRDDAVTVREKEPVMAGFLDSLVLSRDSLEADWRGDIGAVIFACVPIGWGYWRRNARGCDCRC